MRTSLDAEVIEIFRQVYKHVQADVMLAIERCSCDSDFGGTSWTTRAEADLVSRLMNLRPGVRLLEIGAGAGWPGLYMARASGCEVVLTDLPVAGLQVAVDRAKSDRIERSCHAVAADGAALPFRSSTFDAISHSDVLCCLSDKIGVLRACREVVRADGCMVFSVISIAPNLSETDRQQAIDNGPIFIETDCPYDVLLEQAGWHVADKIDISKDFVDTVRRVVDAQNSHEEELRDQLGAAEAAELMARTQNRLAARELGLHRRQLFVVTPVS
ncbi:MAG: class I SAM-dependent methyltransferase [Rhodospirillaceae bacterium]